MALAETTQYAIILASSFAFFAAAFAVSWLLCGRLWRGVWAGLSTAERADWCSRVNSQIHGAAVSPAFVVAIALVEWDADFYPVGGDRATHALRGIMAVSLGYFALDLVAVVLFRVPLFGVFVVHHVVASAPCYQMCFAPSCRDGILALAVFLLVEIATVFLNAQSWLETCGKAGTAWHTFWVYATYAVWVPARLGMPALSLYVWYRAVLFSSRAAQPAACTALVSVCGHAILLFCYAVFFFVLTPAVVRRWRPPREGGAQSGDSDGRPRADGGGSRAHSARGACLITRSQRSAVVTTFNFQRPPGPIVSLDPQLVCSVIFPERRTVPVTPDDGIAERALDAGHHEHLRDLHRRRAVALLVLPGLATLDLHLCRDAACKDCHRMNYGEGSSSVSVGRCHRAWGADPRTS
jgi:hypothetical protein